MEDNQDKQGTYLDKKVFYGLTDLNNGFDAPSIKYFSAADFETVLNRVKEQGLGIIGIEPWKNGEFYDAVSYEEFTDHPADPGWYLMAFKSFRKRNENLQYSVSYFVPGELLDEKGIEI